jgi:hypothetical protein
MGPQDSFGNIQRVAFLPAADYLQGHLDVRFLTTQAYFPDTPNSANVNQTPVVEELKQPFSWERRVLYAKAQADGDPTYFLVRDDFQGATPKPTASFWVMAKDLQFNGNQVHAAGQFGVDLELYSVAPSQAKFGQWSFEHQNWGGEKQLCIRITEQENKPFLTVLYPRRPEEPMPAFTSLAEGNAVKIATPGVQEYAFLSPTAVDYHDDLVAFTAPAGYIRLLADGARIVLNTGGKATAQGITLEATQAASLQIGKDGLQLRTDGEKQTLRLSGMISARPVVTIDGKAARAEMRQGALSIAVSAGAHTIEVK